MKISAKTASPIVIWAKNASSQLLELQLLEFLHLLGSGKFCFLKKDSVVFLMREIREGNPRNSCLVFVVRGSIQHCLRKKNWFAFFIHFHNFPQKFFFIFHLSAGHEKVSTLVGYSYEITSNTKKFATRYKMTTIYCAISILHSMFFYMYINI